QLVDDILRPRLEAGTIVLCDRYLDSTTVYQGYARGHDLDLVRRLNQFATGGLMPALTFLLDLPVEEGLTRQTDRNRMEHESLEFHRRVREGYLAEAHRDAARFQIVDAMQPIEVVHAEILAAVRQVLADV
ncbi:MAG TPA: dTMP kinase, partial [Chthonomonadales bacterium]|nr:dTMP kinase [Chthonomonadales bacterium]